MAVVFQMEKDGELKDGLLGFSWTSFFFSFFVPLIRKDIPAFIGVLAVVIIGNVGMNAMAAKILNSYDPKIGGFMVVTLIFLIIGLVWCFKYNRMYTKKLLEQGWRPVNSEGVRLLKEAGLGSYLLDSNNNDDSEEYEYIEVDDEE